MTLKFVGFNQRLRELIEESGKTHKEIAAETGISKNIIDSYTSKNGSSHPSAENAIRLAKVLGTTAEYLMTGNNPSPFTALSPEQKRLIQNIDALSDRDKSILKLIIQSFIKIK